MARPPTGTHYGSLHVLQAGDIERIFEWTGATWSTPGTGFGTKPGAMAALGWKYLRPAANETVSSTSTTGASK